MRKIGGTNDETVQLSRTELFGFLFCSSIFRKTEFEALKANRTKPNQIQRKQDDMDEKWTWTNLYNGALNERYNKRVYEGRKHNNRK